MILTEQWQVCGVESDRPYVETGSFNSQGFVNNVRFSEETLGAPWIEAEGVGPVTPNFRVFYTLTEDGDETRPLSQSTFSAGGLPCLDPYEVEQNVPRAMLLMGTYWPIE